MNRTYVRVLGAFIVLGLFAAPGVKADEEHDKSKTKSSDSSRTEAKPEIFPAKYDSVISIVTKETEVTALAADKKENNRTFKLGGKKTAIELTAIKEYREKLKNCSDESEVALRKILDDYIAALEKSLTTNVAKPDIFSRARDALSVLRREKTDSSTDKTKFEISERVINTYTLQMRDLIEAKTKKFDKTKTEFEAEDKRFVSALNYTAGALWNSKEEGKFREKIFDAEKAKTDESTKAIVEAVDKAKTSLEKQEKACKLVKTESTDSGKTEDKDGGSKKEEDKASGSKNDKAGPEQETKNPAVDDSTQTPQQQPGTQQPGTQQPGVQQPGAGGLNPGINDPNQLANLGLADLQNGLRALQDALLQQQLANQQLNDDFARAALDQNNDALGKALEALGQQQPPSNRSANRENTEGSPSISPSLDSGGKGGGQPNIPTPPPPPLPQPPPFPMGALQPPPTPTINFPSYGEPKKWDEEPIRRAPVVTQDPRTTGLLELLKMQQQLLLQSQQQRAYGSPNVNGVGGRLTAFGPRGSRRMGRAPMGSSRMKGTASGGSQGRMGSNANARTQAPK